MFDQLIGNARAKEILRRMLRQRRVPGALLFAGEAGLGKKLFALELARALNCREPRGEEACGVCASCARVGRFQYPAADDRDEYKRVIWGDHRDVGLVLPYNRTIYIHAIRDLERESNFRPFEGRARVFIIEGADALGEQNESSANALLKTLEEAPPTTHIVLISSRPASLLPTIRSRCQTVRFAPLGVEEVEQSLVKTKARAGDEARLAARLSGGRPGLAREVNLDTYRNRRDAMLGVVEALAQGNDRAKLLRAAEELGDAKNKDEYEPRLTCSNAHTRRVVTGAHGRRRGRRQRRLARATFKSRQRLAPRARRALALTRRRATRPTLRQRQPTRRNRRALPLDGFRITVPRA